MILLNPRWAKKLGDALHYFEDATCPFHAANDPSFISGDFDHSRFEKEAERRHDRYKLNNGDPHTYDLAFDNSLEDVLLLAAKEAYEIFKRYHLSENESEWEQGLKDSLTRAQQWTVAVLYRYLVESKNIPVAYPMHTIHHIEDHWETFEDLKEKGAGDLPCVGLVACAPFSESLSILAVNNGELWHTIRGNNGSYAHWGYVEDPNCAGEIGPETLWHVQTWPRICTF